MKNHHVIYEREIEALRQEKESFEQLKKQDERWFWLRLIMGYVSIFLLLIVMFVSIYILFNFKNFSSHVVISAGAALFVDILGLLVGVWKIVLSAQKETKLKPATKR